MKIIVLVLILKVLRQDLVLQVTSMNSLSVEMKKPSECQKNAKLLKPLYDDLAEQDNLLGAEINDLNKRKELLDRQRRFLVTDSDKNQFNKSVDKWNSDYNELQEKLDLHSLNIEKYHSIIDSLGTVVE